jgi:hypothetical protein
VCLAATLNAADLDPRFLPHHPDTRYVSFVDYQRLANSKLRGLSLGMTPGFRLEMGTADGRADAVINSTLCCTAMNSASRRPSTGGTIRPRCPALSPSLRSD